MRTAATTNNITAIDSKKATTKQELIAANIKLLMEQLEAGKSDALTSYLTAMSCFHNYIHLYQGNPSLLAESTEVIQQIANIILSASEPSVEAEDASRTSLSTCHSRGEFSSVTRECVQVNSLADSNSVAPRRFRHTA